MDQIPTLDKTFGAAIIGVIFASILYGVSCSQVFYYFNNYSNRDGPVFKTIVIATWVSDTVHQALISHTIYFYLIKGHSNPWQLSELVWSLLVEVIFNGITALLVQSFFAVRIWKLSQGNVFITVTVVIFILGGFASVIVYAVKSLPMTTFVQLATLKPLSMVVNALAVICDVLITVISCVLLHKARRNLSSSDTRINMLISLCVQTGAPTSLCAIASLISISASPGTFIYITFYFMLGRLYCNSLLASLNVRNTIRSRGSSYPGMPLRPISSLNTPTAGKVRPVGSAPELRAISISRTPEQNGSSVLVPPPPTYIGVRPSGGQHSPPRLSLRLNLDGRNESGLSGSVP